MRFVAIVVSVLMTTSVAEAQDETGTSLAVPRAGTRDVEQPVPRGTAGEAGWGELAGGLVGFGLAALAVEGWLAAEPEPVGPGSWFQWWAEASGSAAIYSAGVLTGIGLVSHLLGHDGNVRGAVWGQLFGSIIACVLAASRGAEVALLGIALISAGPAVWGWNVPEGGSASACPGCR